MNFAALDRDDQTASLGRLHNQPDMVFIIKPSTTCYSRPFHGFDLITPNGKEEKPLEGSQKTPT